LRYEDVRAVVSDSYGGVGAAEEFADENGEGAEDGGDAESANELQ
jgi:hypothetical protein